MSISEQRAAKVMAMHDMCSYGRSSLTVVEPILSVLGCQVCPLPTALLSSHFGFPGPTVLNLGDELKKILAHWKTLNLHFECFYSGYLANPQQVDIAEEYITEFSPQFIFVDPVLGDGGKYYPGFGQDQADAMRRLFSLAHMSSPNVTEACLLLEEKPKIFIDAPAAKDFLRRLAAMGPERLCITGVPSPDGKTMTTYGFDAKNQHYYKVVSSSVPLNLHGTGDSFASVLVGLTLQGVSFEHAMLRAAGYLNKAAQLAYEQQEELCIEKAFPALMAGTESAMLEFI